MEISPALSVVAAKQAATQQTAAFNIMKKQHDMQMDLINMLSEVAANAPVPEGQGSKVDKTA